jgi:DNA repair exonuclease SbcCD nuclease subunit
MNPPDEQDMALNFIHTADWHLGRTFTGFRDSDQVKLSQARLKVVEQIFREAIQLRCDAVLCAGDLFNTPRPDKDVWEGLLRLLEKLQFGSCQVFLLPGNHDPCQDGSVYSATHPFRAGLPPQVHVVDKANFEFAISDEAVLYASPCESQAGQDELASKLPSRETGDDRIRIGMVHGQTFDMPGYMVDFPIDLKTTAANGFDYLAMGDTHSYRETRDGNFAAVYPGAPEATKFGETDSGYAAHVFFRRSGRKPHIQKKRVGRWIWRAQTCTDLPALESLLTEPDLDKTVLKLALEMTVSLQDFHRVEEILDQLASNDFTIGKVGIIQVDRSRLEQQAVTANEFPDDLPDVIKATIAQLEASEDRQTADRALSHLYKLIHHE